MNLSPRLTMLVAALAAKAAVARAGAPTSSDEPRPTPAAALPDPAAMAPCLRSVAVAGAAKWLQILPERPPPTATRLSFDERNGGHLEVVWDPYDARGLARTVLLTTGEWQVSFWAEPQRDSMQFANNFAWQSRAQRCEDTWPTNADESTVIVEERRGQAATYVTISLKEPATSPALLDGFTAASGRGDAERALSALRSFDVGGLPTQTSDVVVRVVTRAVKKRALKLASRKVQEVLCEASGKGASSGAEVGKGEARAPKLARTCEAIKGIDLQTLSSAARPVALAISLDLLAQALIAAKVDPHESIVEAIETGIALLHERPDLGAAEIKHVLLAAAAGYFERPAIDAGTLAAQVALRVVAHCRDSGPCDAAMVRRLLLEPSTYFALSGVSPEVVKNYIARAKVQVAQLEQFVAEGQRVFETARSMANVDRLRAAIRANLRLVALAACFASESACTSSKALVRLATHVSHGDLRGMVHDVSALVPGLLDERQRRRLSIVMALVERAAAVVAASTDERKLAGAQVEAALDVVVDDAVDRDGRGGDWVFSLGTGVRAHAAFRVDGGGLRGTASVPLAISVDRLCKAKGDRFCPLGGLHLEVGFLDVGNYVRVRDIELDDLDKESFHWNDLASLSVGAGIMFGAAEMPVYFGVTGGIAPGDGDDGTHGWRAYAGGYAGMYIPIIDLN